jgi:hypothetical protein
MRLGEVPKAGAAGAAVAAERPAAGRVGNLIVGAEVGLGGKLMRTVSFFGWTLPVSVFFGGAGGTVGGPGVGLGMWSAIYFNLGQTRFQRRKCQTLIEESAGCGVQDSVS